MKKLVTLSMKMFVPAVLMFNAGCSKTGKDNKPGGIFYGPTHELANGSIRSFVTLDDAGIPQSIGMKFTEAALSGLPTDTTTEHDTPVALPIQAGTTGFDHLEVDWNPIGHEPKAIYGLPHFDFHFYMITKTEQESVIPGPDTFKVPSINIPQDYQSGVIAVPDMGVHWFDSKAPEFSGQIFTDTYIYGFYHGKMTFVEPMITKSFISTKPDFILKIKQPQAFQRNGYYPTTEHLYFDNETKEYTVSLEGLIYHSAN